MWVKERGFLELVEFGCVQLCSSCKMKILKVMLIIERWDGKGKEEVSCEEELQDRQQAKEAFKSWVLKEISW